MLFLTLSTQAFEYKIQKDSLSIDMQLELFLQEAQIEVKTVQEREFRMNILKKEI